MSRFDRVSERSGSRAFAFAHGVVWLGFAAFAMATSGCPLTDDYDVTGGAGGASANTSSGMTVGPTGGVVCEWPPPLGGACPSECTACDGATCIIACADCEDATLNCPPGFACEVRCGSKDACKDTTVQCSPGFSCEVRCERGDACKGLRVLCAAGECEVVCSQPNACKDATLECALGGACACTGLASPLSVSGCESACSCAGCD